MAAPGTVLICRCESILWNARWLSVSSPFLVRCLPPPILPPLWLFWATTMTVFAWLMLPNIVSRVAVRMSSAKKILQQSWMPFPMTKITARAFPLKSWERMSTIWALADMQAKIFLSTMAFPLKASSRAFPEAHLAPQASWMKWYLTAWPICSIWCLPIFRMAWSTISSRICPTLIPSTRDTA